MIVLCATELLTIGDLMFNLFHLKVYTERQLGGSDVYFDK
jgi:hypothetical protein